jgi:hypothetical protein
MQARGTRAARATGVISLLCLAATAQAQKLTYGVDAGVGESDNVTLAHDNKTSQTIAVTDFDLDYRQRSQRLDADAKGNFSFLDYLQHAYGSQLVGRFDGSADVALIPQRLTWGVQEHFGQAALDPFTPTTPNNRENINSLATGPDLYLRLGGASFIDMSARVADIHYQTSPFSNTRATGSLAWGLKLSPLSSVSLNADTQHVDFQNTQLNTNFERTNVFARYALQGARTDLSVDLGATQINESGNTTTGGLGRFKASRRISASARLNLTFGHEITDGSSSFSGPQVGVAGAATPAVNSSGNYTSNYASLGWEYQRNRTTLTADGRWEKDRYLGLPQLDRTLTTGEIRLARLVTRDVTVQIAATLQKYDYDNVNVGSASIVPILAPGAFLGTAINPNGSPNATTSTIIAGLTWRHGRALEVKFSAEHTTYTTSPNNTGYGENRAFLTVGYRPFRDTATQVLPGLLDQASQDAQDLQPSRQP